MLGCNDGFDDRGKVVDVWESFHTEQDIIERALLGIRSIFRSSDNYSNISAAVPEVVMGIEKRTMSRFESFVAKGRRSMIVVSWLPQVN